MKLSSLLVIVLLGLCCSCGSRPSGVLPERKMASVLADLSLVEAVGDRRLPGGEASDSVYRVYRQSIMARHGVSEAEFDSTLAWYGHHLDEYSALYTAVDKRLEQRQKSYEKQVGTAPDQQEASLMPLPAMLSIGANDPDRGFSFALDGKRFKKGDCLTMKMRFNHLSGSATVYLAAEYPKGEALYLRRQVHGSGPVEMQIQTDSARLPSRIVGYVHLPEAPLRRVWVDSLTLTAAPLVPSSYHRVHVASRLTPMK